MRDNRDAARPRGHPSGVFRTLALNALDFRARWTDRATAAMVALAVPLALRALSLPRVLALCDRWPRIATQPARPLVLAQRTRRWMAFGRGPWTSTCLTRSAVLYAMLRQHGYAPEFFVGVAGSAREFEAHAWVTVNGRPVDQPERVADEYRLLVAHHA